MENKDPLFDNIGRNARKIKQTPSLDAWTKLEAQLDKHERPQARRRTLPGLGILSIAASVLLLVGLVFVISQTVLKPNKSMATAERQAMPQQVEDLPLLASNDAISSPQMAEYQRKINANPRGVIKEGGYHKKLVAQPLNRTKHSATAALVTMKNFDWILGEWKTNSKTGTSTETWEEFAPGHFKGTGTFTNIDNQSIFTEQMALIEKDNNIYFEAITQSEGEKVAYVLQDFENRSATFYNENIDFPTHVIITRTASGGFTIAFKNIPPVAVPDKNTPLKNSRNLIKSKEIIRTLNQKI